MKKKPTPSTKQTHNRNIITFRAPLDDMNVWSRFQRLCKLKGLSQGECFKMLVDARLRPKKSGGTIVPKSTSKS